MIVIITAVLVVLVVFLLALIKILFWLSKYFKLENVTYKKSMLILFCTGFASLIVGVFLQIINFEIMHIIFEFLLFHYFLKKYYQNSWKKSIKIYIAVLVSYVVLS